ncbi:hypothetical protein ANH9381_0055 [Aggregatibacter actinomycetemcomitans ANH9381]|nr:hypothetical protein ANH9381_0055 [Aggregatibacter actinomycetemcomitans ANH9381]
MESGKRAYYEKRAKRVTDNKKCGYFKKLFSKRPHFFTSD